MAKIYLVQRTDDDGNTSNCSAWSSRELAEKEVARGHHEHDPAYDSDIEEMELDRPEHPPHLVYGSMASASQRLAGGRIHVYPYSGWHDPSGAVDVEFETYGKGPESTQCRVSGGIPIDNLKRILAEKCEEWRRDHPDVIPVFLDWEKEYQGLMRCHGSGSLDRRYFVFRLPGDRWAASLATRMIDMYRNNPTPQEMFVSEAKAKEWCEAKERSIQMGLA